MTDATRPIPRKYSCVLAMSSAAGSEAITFFPVKKRDNRIRNFFDRLDQKRVDDNLRPVQARHLDHEFPPSPPPCGEADAASRPAY